MSAQWSADCTNCDGCDVFFRINLRQWLFCSKECFKLLPRASALADHIVGNSQVFCDTGPQELFWQGQYVSSNSNIVSS